MKSKVPVSPTPSNSESAAAELSDAPLVPAFLTEAQAAAYVGETVHQLYLRRRRGDGPPFILHGSRVRYAIADLKQWAAALPRFTSYAAALAANPKRAEGAHKQAATSATARKARWASDQP
jgi:hypothetical protein